jgi:hypothetical protein
LSAVVDGCTKRFEGEVAKLQADLALCATEAEATELGKSISLLTEQLQALISRAERDMQDVNIKLAEQLRFGLSGLMVSLCVCV